MPDTNGVDSWKEWRKHVLYQLEQNHTEHEAMRTTLSELTEELITLKVSVQTKSKVYGALAGAIPGVIAILVSIFIANQ